MWAHDKKDETPWDTSHSKGAPLRSDKLHTSPRWGRPLSWPLQHERVTSGRHPATPTFHWRNFPGEVQVDLQCYREHLTLAQTPQR